MELLVVTLTQTSPAREADAMARIRLISDTVRNAPGLLNARFYHSQEPEAFYFVLTTWENMEWWQKAQERYSPRKLLLSSPAGIFHAHPDQWLMEYIWGYSRPQARPVVAAAHLAMVHQAEAERVQQEWLASLQFQAIEPILSFALLARGIGEEPVSSPRPASTPPPYPQPERASRRPATQGSIFLNLLSWPSETYRKDFYADEGALSVQKLITATGVLRVLKLEPM
jgi:hypothetical protein